MARRSGVLLFGAVLAFVPIAPTSAGGPSIDVSPATDLSDGQRVSVTGAGFSDDLVVQLLQCSNEPIPGSNPPQSLCDVDATVQASADDSGGLGPVDFPVQRVIRATNFDDSAVDCGAPPGCTLVASGGPGQVTWQPLAFGSSAPPMLFATASDDHRWIAWGYGFTRDELLQIMQCSSEPLPGSDPPEAACDASTAVAVTVDTSGTFGPVSLEVQTTLESTGSDEDVDCRRMPGCAFVAQQGNSFSVHPVDLSGANPWSGQQLARPYPRPSSKSQVVVASWMTT